MKCLQNEKKDIYKMNTVPKIIKVDLYTLIKDLIQKKNTKISWILSGQFMKQIVVNLSVVHSDYVFESKIVDVA